MFKTKYILAIAVAAMLGAAAPSQAVTLDVVGGRLVGAFFVPVMGMQYNVRFADLSCADEFDGCDEASDFAFNNAADAQAAAQSLLDNVFLNGPMGAFDTDPTLTFGCGNATFCLHGIPYEIDGLNVNVSAAQNFAVEASDTTIATISFPQDTSLGNDTNIFNTANWAVFEKVPEPGTLAVFGLGLAGLGFARRRKARA